MRTPEEIFSKMSVGLQTATEWMKVIESAQKEAYNEAIEDAAKCAAIVTAFSKDRDSALAMEKEVLKLKKFTFIRTA